MHHNTYIFLDNTHIMCLIALDNNDNTITTNKLSIINAHIPYLHHFDKDKKFYAHLRHKVGATLLEGGESSTHTFV